MYLVRDDHNKTYFTDKEEAKKCFKHKDSLGCYASLQIIDIDPLTELFELLEVDNMTDAVMRIEGLLDDEDWCSSYR